MISPPLGTTEIILWQPLRTAKKHSSPANDNHWSTITGSDSYLRPNCPCCLCCPFILPDPIRNLSVQIQQCAASCVIAVRRKNRYFSQYRVQREYVIAVPVVVVFVFVVIIIVVASFSLSLSSSSSSLSSLSPSTSMPMENLVDR